MINPQRPHDDSLKQGVSASVQVLPLPIGLYLFSVRDATPGAVAAVGNLTLPAVHVGLGPGGRAEDVQFLTGPATHGAWLFAPGDLLVARVSGAATTLLLTSVRQPGAEVLSIKVERLESRLVGETALAPARKSARPVGEAPEPASNAAPAAGLPLQINAHLRARGDRTFTNVPWAGRVEPGLWIESFSVKPLETFTARDIEYKGLTASGFETPWLSDDLPCGTKGMAMALIGFAARLKPSAKAAAYDCEYSGYFHSGTVTGPFRNGAPCRSTVANDPLEGLQIRIVSRPTSIGKQPANTAAAGAGAPPRPVSGGPTFGKYRDTAGGAVEPGKATSAASGTASPAAPKSTGKSRAGKAREGIGVQPLRRSAKPNKRGAAGRRRALRPASGR